MAEYSLSELLENKNIFIVKRSSIGERFDPKYHIVKKELLCEFKYPLEKIENSFIVKDGDHDKLPSEAIRRDNQGKRYLRAQDLKDNQIINDNPIYITDDYFNKITRCHIYPGDLLVSIMASLGATAIVPGDYPVCTANRAIGILRQKENGKLLPEYVQVLMNTNLGFALFEVEKKGGIQQRLNLSDITNVQLPTPKKEIQQEIVNRYHEALNNKQQREKEAWDLLKGIDDYLLNELGITLPQRQSDLQSRIFTVSFSEVTGSRFDVFAVLNKDYRIEGGVYENLSLRQVANLVKGQSITSDKIIPGNIPVIAGGQTSPYSHNVFNFEGNVITVSASGAYSGYVWYHSNPIFASDCTVIKSKDEDKISTLFLAEILKLKQKEIYNLQQGAGQPHVYSSDLVKLNIPVPPPSKQKKFVQHIQSIRIKADEMLTIAATSFEEAKAEIEKLILG